MHNDMVEDELEISEVYMLLIYLTFFSLFCILCLFKSPHLLKNN